MSAKKSPREQAEDLVLALASPSKEVSDPAHDRILKLLTIAITMCVALEAAIERERQEEES